MIKYILLFIAAFVYEIGVSIYQLSTIKGKIKRAIIAVGFSEPSRWIMVAFVASVPLGSTDQFIMVVIIVFAFQIATYVSLKYINNTERFRK